MQIFNQIPPLWNSYQRFVEVAILSPDNSKTSESEQISDRVFLNAIKYGIPLGIVVILISIGLTAGDGFNLFSFSGIFLFLFTAIISLIRKINLPLRKLLASIPLVIIATISFLYQGTSSSGFIYLLLFSIFYALQVNRNYATLTIFINAMVCIFVLCAHKFHLNIGTLGSLNLKVWLIGTVNFLFLNIVTVVMIRQTIKSLEQLISSKISMGKKLNDEIFEKTALNTSLDATENRYKKLFHMSPCAQLILDTETKSIIKVNQAARTIYGYTESEFLKMKLSDILLTEDNQELLKKMSNATTEDLKRPLHFKTIGKGSVLLDTEILWGDIELKGISATLLIVNDVTLQFSQFSVLSRQNTILKKIVHIQSHSIRPPLTKIMSLTQLIAEEYATEANRPLFDYLSISAKELDELIHEVIKESELILNEIDSSLPLGKA